MPVWKLQTAFALDSTLSRDLMLITPHFDDHGATTDPQGLCDDLAAALASWAIRATQVTVKAYDAEGTKPVYPAGEAVQHLGSSPASQCPREVALCLSFFSGHNAPRWRGRLYIPFPVLMAQDGVAPAGRPTSTARASVGALAPIFQDLGGPDVDWSVYSKKDGVARPVTNWWVDDEFDTVRSRGQRATMRLTGTTSEA